MGKANSQTNPKSTNNKFWQFRNLADDDQKAELLLYGDISERSWWEDAATPKRFADDLAALGDVKEITVYINSGGGDVFAAQAIGNMLERNAATVTAHIDGLCASAATIVACHADKVVAAADGSYMVHPVSMGVCDYLTAEDMEKLKQASSPECTSPDDSLYDQREAEIMHGLFDHMEGVRPDLDLHVVANLIKIMAMAKVNRDALHADALDRTLDHIYGLLYSLIFEEGA